MATRSSKHSIYQLRTSVKEEYFSSSSNWSPRAAAHWLWLTQHVMWLTLNQSLLPEKTNILICQFHAYPWNQERIKLYPNDQELKIEPVVPQLKRWSGYQGVKSHLPSISTLKKLQTAVRHKYKQLLCIYISIYKDTHTHSGVMVNI